MSHHVSNTEEHAMPTLHNARYERALSLREIDPVVIDGEYGVVCTLVPRCEGIVPRFTVRDTSTVPSTVVGERHEARTVAVFALERTYGLCTMVASRVLHLAEQDAWRRLHDQGIDVPASFRGVSE